jgi:hypothetical protein
MIVVVPRFMTFGRGYFRNKVLPVRHKFKQFDPGIKLVKFTAPTSIFNEDDKFTLIRQQESTLPVFEQKRLSLNATTSLHLRPQSQK